MNPKASLERLAEAVGSLFRSREEIELRSGSIGKPLFFLSLPVVLTNLFQTAYNLADTFWLGQYSTEALAAISFAWPPVFLLMMLGMGISVAGSVLVAQNTGAEEHREAELAAAQTITDTTVVALLFGTIAYFVARPFVAFLGASPEVVGLAAGYLEIISLGFVFMMVYMVFNALMRGYGDTLTPMVVMFGTVLLNIVLDPFLIFGWGLPAHWPVLDGVAFPELGIRGAAYATIFSRAVGLVVGLAIMFGDRWGITIHWSDLRPRAGYLLKILRIGAPASVEGVSRAISVNLLMLVVGWFATPIVAAYGIGTRIFSMVFLPGVAVDRSVETMTGQNIGAEKPDRAAAAARIAAITLFIVLSLLGAVTYLLASPIAGLFTDDPAVVAAATQFLRYVAPSFGFIGVMRAYSGSLRGAGKTLTVAAIAIVMLAVVRFPVAWVLAERIGESGIWLSYVVSNVAGAVVAYAWYQRGTWREKRLT
ncbi:MATE family drug/sodium antiporter [Halodesulfurarchaeum formicicum]|uniref:MATE family drug/sodium antiporter n=1 Tax=Halodesulfurarchaeum formicicum TaxID=1873524 RepID=A0A1D8S516_9EURY|nr:MATE family efflux transporter [Halodesulfurarchaeum formicicum]AOW80443.1 MATE family drug/sodium antiporter [Halodesulfurarchaeum formicicum]APE95782.1 MATE family drug/sodium antiporter [Halodesulfurarchaeum formicicum]